MVWKWVWPDINVVSTSAYSKQRKHLKWWVFRQAFELGTCQIQVSSFTSKLTCLIKTVVLFFSSPEVAIEQSTRLLPIPTFLTRNGNRPACQVENFIVTFNLSRKKVGISLKYFKTDPFQGITIYIKSLTRENTVDLHSIGGVRQHSCRRLSVNTWRGFRKQMLFAICYLFLLQQADIQIFGPG